MHMKNLLNKLNGLLAENEVTESPMNRRAPAESHTCETCGRSMPNWEPGDSTECDECELGMSSKDSDPDQLDEFSDHVSCWGCGQDWRDNWSVGDLGPGEGYDEYGLESDDQICPDCAEELTGGELQEGSMCEDCGTAPCVCEDPLAEKKLTGEEKRKREQLVKGMKGADWEERYPGRGEEVMYATATKKAKELAEQAQDFEPSPECVSACYDNEQHSPLCVHYRELAEQAQDFAPTPECVSACYDNEQHSPLCVHYRELAEDEIVQEAKHTIEAHGVKGMQSTRWRKTFKNEADLNAWLENNNAEMYGMRELEPGDKQGTVKEAKECNCAGPCDCEKNAIAEMRQLAGLTECGEMYAPMPAAQPTNLQQSKLTVTTSMDSEAGTKQVTVSAEGEGADELIRVLQMAGVSVAPGSSTTVVDEVANEPKPQTLGSKSMMLDLAGGPNAPHGQYNSDRARDNSMSMMGEAVDRLTARLQAQFKSQK